mgnify:CR=1 FL=1
MRKGKTFGKIFVIIGVFVLVEAMLGKLPSSTFPLADFANQTQALAQGWDPWAYDEDNDGEIQKIEAIHAVQDYFDWKITKMQAIKVVMLYFGARD